jgi:REP element-mobilizing transposase RayT
MSYRQILYHTIFRTKYSQETINLENAQELYRYIWGVIKNNNCKLYQINGMEDHIHILSDLHPMVCFADLVKDIKVASSKWAKSSGLFPGFQGWAKKYCTLTYSYKEKDVIINYIKNQRNHHKKENFHDEMIRLFLENNILDEEAWFWKED